MTVMFQGDPGEIRDGQRGLKGDPGDPGFDGPPVSDLQSHQIYI